MKSKFPGYVDNYFDTSVLTSEKVLIAFDTNILLNLYRYEKSISDDIINQIKSLKENVFFELWLPHQVALEFNLNRKNVIKNQERAVNLIESKFRSFKKDIKGLSTVGGKNSELHPLKDELISPFNDIDKIIKSHLPKGNNSRGKDSVVKVVYELFDGIVGDSYTDEEMTMIDREGEHRYQHNIPPGFEDDAKESVYSYSGIKVNAKYGDFILWKQLIDKAILEKLTVVLVTGDEKDDWQCKEFGRVRPELITEFKLKTGQEFFALTLPNFQRLFDKKLKHKLSPHTTTEITALTKKDSKGWLNEVLSAFEHYGRSLTLNEVNEYVIQNSDRDFPITWDGIIRRTIYNHCSDVKLFRGKKDLFKKVGSGLYELRK